MKRVIIVLIVFIIFYLLLQLIFINFGKGHIINYKIDGFNINEELLQNINGEVDNYYIEIKKDDLVFSYQLFMRNRGSNLVKKIKYFKNSNYECIVPILKLKDVKVEPICKKDGIYYYLSTIDDSEVIDYFKEYKVKNNNKKLKEKNNITIYNNLIDNHYISLDYYKGIYLINKKDKLKKVDLFKKEIYDKELSFVIKNYYVIADYNELYDFHKFYLINLENYKIDTIISDKEISLNSYVMGIIDNEAYIFDIDNKTEYMIDIDAKDIYEVGNEKKGIKKYVNGEFVKGNVYEASDKLLFSDYTNKLDEETYSRVELIGGKKSGYYYLYKLNNDKYDVYRVPSQNHEVKTYLFTTTDINSIKHTKEYIYYAYDNLIKRFNEFEGNIDIIKYNDLKYNKTLKFNIYER